MKPQCKFYAYLALLQLSILTMALALPEPEEKGLERRVFVADDIIIAGWIILTIGTVAAMIISDILMHRGHSSVSDSHQYVGTNASPSYQASAYTTIFNLVNNVYNQNPNARVVAVKAFVPVTGQETLGILGQDWGSVWVPIQTSPTTATTYVIWWTNNRGGALTINDGSTSDYAVSPGVGLVSAGWGQPMTVYL